MILNYKGEVTRDTHYISIGYSFKPYSVIFTRMLFISPPFGNYIHFSGTMSIKGSYTLHPRPGLLLRIVKTFRYSFAHNGWVNRIGLRNNGLVYGLNNYKPGRDVLSIAILDEKEINPILSILPDDVNIELNISCPNVKEHTLPSDLSRFVNPKRRWCMVKLSPTTDMKLVEQYYKQGFRQFHCCNTIPVTEGGLSGKSILRYSLGLVEEIRSRYDDTEIVGGGGIYDTETLHMYQQAGARHYSISTIFLAPIKFLQFYFQHMR